SGRVAAASWVDTVRRRPSEAGGDVLGRHEPAVDRRDVLEGHIWPQLEGDLRLVGRVLPRLGGVRLDAAVRPRQVTGFDLDQAAVHHLAEGSRARCEAVRVPVLGVAIGAQLEDPAAPGLARGVLIAREQAAPGLPSGLLA